METKICNVCKLSKDINSFSKDNRQKDSLNRTCRQCRSNIHFSKHLNPTFNVLPPLPENSKLISDIPEYSDFLGYCMDINAVMYTCRKRQFGYYGKWTKLSHSLKNKRICYCITNGKNNKFVLSYRILAMLFIQNLENKPWINHIDSNPLNNSLSNLEWCTPKENSRHAVEFGFLPKGSGVKTSKLKESEVIEIRQKRRNGLKIKDIASYYSVSVGTIERIVANKTWKHVI